MNPLPNITLDGPFPSVSGGNNVSRGRSVHREVSRRVSVVGNEAAAGDFYRASHVALSSDRVPLRNRGDSIVVETLSNATGYVRRGRSIHRAVRGQRGGRVGSRNDSSPSCAHSARARGRSGRARAARSRSRGGVTRGRGAIMHSLSQDHTMKHYKKCHLDG